MSANIPLKAFVSLFCGIFIFSLSSQLSFYILPRYLLENGTSQTEIENIELLEMVGRAGAGFILTQIVNLANNKKIMLLSLVIFLISKINTVIVTDYNLLKIHFMIMAGSAFTYLVLSLVKIIEYFPSHKNLSIGLFVFLWAIGRVVGERTIYLFDQFTLYNSVILNAILYASVILTILYLKDNSHEDSFFKIKFTTLIENIELEIVAGLVVAYVAMSIYWDYEIFALVQELPLADTDTIRDYMLVSLLIGIGPILWLMSLCNKYWLNLFFWGVLFISFISLLYIGKHEVSNIIVLVLIGTALGSIFTDNLLILAEKFEGEHLRTAIFLYFTLSSIGTYIGMHSTDKVVTEIGENGFLFSNCFVVGIFILYYLFQFTRKRLYSR